MPSASRGGLVAGGGEAARQAPAALAETFLEAAPAAAPKREELVKRSEELRQRLRQSALYRPAAGPSAAASPRDAAAPEAPRPVVVLRPGPASRGPRCNDAPSASSRASAVPPPRLGAQAHRAPLAAPRLRGERLKPSPGQASRALTLQQLSAMARTGCNGARPRGPSGGTEDSFDDDGPPLLAEPVGVPDGVLGEALSGDMSEDEVAHGTGTADEGSESASEAEVECEAERLAETPPVATLAPPDTQGNAIEPPLSEPPSAASPAAAVPAAAAPAVTEPAVTASATAALAAISLTAPAALSPPGRAPADAAAAAEGGHRAEAEAGVATEAPEATSAAASPLAASVAQVPPILYVAKSPVPEEEAPLAAGPSDSEDEDDGEAGSASDSDVDMVPAMTVAASVAPGGIPDAANAEPLAAAAAVAVPAVAAPAAVPESAAAAATPTPPAREVALVAPPVAVAARAGGCAANSAPAASAAAALAAANDAVAAARAALSAKTATAGKAPKAGAPRPASADTQRPAKRAKVAGVDSGGSLMRGWNSLLERTRQHYQFAGEYTKRFAAEGKLWRRAQPSPRVRLVLGLDCEMVYAKDDNNALARVSVVSVGGTLLNVYVKRPSGDDVLDYRTAISGVEPHHLLEENGAVPYEVAQDKVLALLSPDTILVGHALQNDLRALRICHTKVVDTALLFTVEGKNLWRKHKLHSLVSIMKPKVATLQAMKINASHDSIQDAEWALQLALYEAAIYPRRTSALQLESFPTKVLLSEIPKGSSVPELKALFGGRGTLSEINYQLQEGGAEWIGTGTITFSTQADRDAAFANMRRFVTVHVGPLLDWAGRKDIVRMQGELLKHCSKFGRVKTCRMFKPNQTPDTGPTFPVAQIDCHPIAARTLLTTSEAHHFSAHPTQFKMQIAKDDGAGRKRFVVPIGNSSFVAKIQ